MTDASRAVGVASAMVDPEQRAVLSSQVQVEYREIAERRASGRAAGRRISIQQARGNRLRPDGAQQPIVPLQPGLHVFDDYDLAEIAAYIDWTPFFRTWELKGTFPKIFQDPIVGETARALHDDAHTMLARLVERALDHSAGRGRPVACGKRRR